MSDDQEDLPEHLRALLGAEPESLLGGLEGWLGRSAEKVATGRLSRAFKMGRLAASSGSRLALHKAQQLLGHQGGPAISREVGLKLAAEMLETFSELRGVAMKLGQMLSYVDDNLPPEARRVLALLQRDAPSLPFDEVRRVIEGELERPLEAAFAELDERPLAAASIGQVHRGRLLDGTWVAVKVQYPGVDRAMSADLKNARVVGIFKQALFVNTDIKAIIEELQERLLDECNYLKEADYQEAFRERFAGHPVVVIPAVRREVSTQRVLVTELKRGRTFYQWLEGRPSFAERERVARTFYRFYLGSFYLDGLFNCDPHPGNYLFLEDGRVAFLDFGCTRRFSDERRRLWVEAARTVRRDREDELHQSGLELGFLRPEVSYDRQAYRDLMRWIYQPYLEDVPYDFSRHQPMETYRAMISKNPNLFKLDMPPEALFLNRITFGLVSLLTQIGAPINCYRLADSYFERRDPDWPSDPHLG